MAAATVLPELEQFEQFEPHQTPSAEQQAPLSTAAAVGATAAAAAVAAPTTTAHSDDAEVFLQPALPIHRIACHAKRHGGGRGSGGGGKQVRSRSKFGCRKQPKLKHSTVSYELDETLPPATRCDVVPKWNNGWTWEGEAFQGAVFLNNVNPLVMRTCYPAMRHSEGDIIRTRDCVVLKANEDNELPYVAKVAYLWDNPEDGEMMMSLLWYYRPEHTKQGRQCNDSPDEVYASRHRDHNSVACIEDKCYVLTFSEYCRYRRRRRAAEEGIEDVSIVPKRPDSDGQTCTVPDRTNPELVMFCRRAYEFRTKRLLKIPNKPDYKLRRSRS